jgi:CHRD domain
MIGLRYPVAIFVIIWTIILMSNIAFAQVSFRTDLVGEAEVPPLFSESYGSALIVGNNSSLTYQINLTSLDKVTGAFLYKGDSTENGEVLVSLLNSTEPSGVINGTLVEGSINSSSILVPLANLTTNITLAVPSAGNLTNMTSAVPGAGNLTNMTSAVPGAGNLTNMTSAVPGAGNLTNMTSAVPGAGNLTNMTSAVPAPSKLESLIDLMYQNMTYINIHTSKFPEGELRGTLTNSTG